MSLESKPKNKSLMLFMQLFTRKRNPYGKLIKYEARLYFNSTRQVNGADYQNSHVPIVQLATTRVMLILHQINRLDCRRADYILTFTQANAYTDIHFKNQIIFHTQNTNGKDVSELHCPRLLKNCYRRREIAVNQYSKLEDSLE